MSVFHPFSGVLRRNHWGRPHLRGRSKSSRAKNVGFRGMARHNLGLIYLKCEVESLSGGSSDGGGSSLRGRLITTGDGWMKGSGEVEIQLQTLSGNKSSPAPPPHLLHPCPAQTLVRQRLYLKSIFDNFTPEPLIMIEYMSACMYVLFTLHQTV